MKKEFNSSLIKAADYDNDNRVLKITFPNGSVYEYIRVPLYKWVGLCESDSAGVYFTNNIKNKYAHKKL
jgi:hypothetical protein